MNRFKLNKFVCAAMVGAIVFAATVSAGVVIDSPTLGVNQLNDRQWHHTGHFTELKAGPGNVYLKFDKKISGTFTEYWTDQHSYAADVTEGEWDKTTNVQLSHTNGEYRARAWGYLPSYQAVNAVDIEFNCVSP